MRFLNEGDQQHRVSIAIIDSDQHGGIVGDPFPTKSPYVVLHCSVIDSPHLLQRVNVAQGVFDSN